VQQGSPLELTGVASRSKKKSLWSPRILCGPRPRRFGAPLDPLLYQCDQKNGVAEKVLPRIWFSWRFIL